ncbi:MAG: hypothetical protein WB902_22285 [Acetobacteraceae bacterium]
MTERTRCTGRAVPAPTGTGADEKAESDVGDNMMRTVSAIGVKDA